MITADDFNARIKCVSAITVLVDSTENPNSVLTNVLNYIDPIFPTDFVNLRL